MGLEPFVTVQHEGQSWKRRTVSTGPRTVRVNSGFVLDIFYYFMCMSVLFVCMCVPGACGGQKRASDALGLESPVGAGN